MNSPLLLYLSTLIALSILFAPVSSGCSCCPKLNIALSCGAVGSTVKQVDNGYRCVAKTGAEVSLNCVVPDLVTSGVVTSVTYKFWKAANVVQPSVFSRFSTKHELTNSECNRSGESSSTCKLSNVQWKSETNQLTDHDSLVYQCQATVTLSGDSEPVVIFSNSMWLDVMYNIDTSSVAAGTTDTRDIRSKEPATKIACTIPATNPPSKAVWYKYSDSASAWSAIDFSTSPRKFVVEKVIHSSSSQSSLQFVLGSLVIALFKEEDKGSYRCNIEYIDEFKTSTSYPKVSNYTLTWNSYEVTDAGTAALVSQITQHEYIFEKENSSFTCHGRDIDASAATGPPYRYSWSYKLQSDYISINKTYKVWPGITFTNYNRTMTFNADHTMTGTEYYCTVTKVVSGATATTVKSTKFKPPAILPEVYIIPSTNSQCTDDITKELLFEPNKYLFSNPSSLYNPDVATQNLSGTSHAWLEAGIQLSTFENQYTVVNGSELRLNLSKEASKSKPFHTNKCRYLQLLRVYDKLYQMQEVFGLVRPNAPSGKDADTCGSITEDDLKVACDDKGNITLTVTKANAGCLRGSIKPRFIDSPIMEKTLGCGTSTSGAVHTICNINTDCKQVANNTGEYSAVIVVDGDSEGAVTIHLPNCQTPEPPEPEPGPTVIIVICVIVGAILAVILVIAYLRRDDIIRIVCKKGVENNTVTKSELENDYQ